MLAEPRQLVVGQLHARQDIGAVGDQTEILDAGLAPLARLIVLRAMETRAIAKRKRGLMLSGQAVMQSPVSAQPLAQAFERAPSPVCTMSTMPAITSLGAASTPAGAVTGHISTHLPQRVQASIISAVRADKAVSNVISLIFCMLAARRRAGQWRCCSASSRHEIASALTPIPHEYFTILREDPGLRRCAGGLSFA